MSIISREYSCDRMYCQLSQHYLSVPTWLLMLRWRSLWICRLHWLLTTPPSHNHPHRY